MHVFARLLTPLVLATTLFACSSGGGRSGFDTDEGSQTAESPKPDGGGGTFAPGSDAGGDDATCAAVTAKPEAPQVDVIFVIDDSASMTAEMTQVKQNVNAFAAKIGQSGLDYRVLFLVKRATSPTQTGNVICVPPPLGGPNCTDNPPRFFHVNQDVQSNDSLSLILSTYDSSNPSVAWASHLRQAAFKVFIEVSDDGGYDMAAQSFDDQLLAKGPSGMFGTAQKRNYAFHAICGWDPSTAPPSATKCATADHSGQSYQSLALLTGGLIDSVCKTDYSSVLDHLAQGISSRLACELGYPTSVATDPKKVVVQMTPSGGAPSALTQVVDASHCNVVQDGWYYDDPSHPSKIELCPSTCDTANKTSGTIDALVGCSAPSPR